MTAVRFKYIYGPVYSWRIGMSLGVDPLAEVKYCNFDCPYCQLGHTKVVVSQRKVFVPVEDIISEVAALPAGTVVDYVTFSGNGEPTLAANLGEMIREVRRRFGYRTAVITNASTVTDPAVRADLAEADLVLFKLEAADEAVFKKMNRPAEGITLAGVIAGIKEFKKAYQGRMALQIMFTAVNIAQAEQIAAIARDIGPDEVQLNTPLRPSPVRPLNEKEMAGIKAYFGGLEVRSVYEEEKKPYQPWDEQATVKRHGKYKVLGNS